MRKLVLSLMTSVAFVATTISSNAQTAPLPERMANSVIAVWNDSTNHTYPGFEPVKWSYDLGVIYEGLDAIWRRTGDVKYYKAMQQNMDSYLTKDGEIRNYKITDRKSVV